VTAPGADAASRVLDDYTRRLDTRRAALQARERAHLRMSRVRLLVAATVIPVLWFGGPAAPAWLLLPAIAFLISAAVHARVLNARDRAASAVAFYERGLTRLRDDWIGRGNAGERYRPEHHPYAVDLDLFGRGSLFERLATIRTQAGEARLAQWLLAPAPPDEIAARQDAVRELAPQVDLREEVAVLGDGVRVGVDAPILRAWASAPVRLGRPAIRLALGPLSAITGSLGLALVVWLFLPSESPLLVRQAFVILGAAQIGIAAWFRNDVHGVLHAVDPASRDLELLSGLVTQIERASFASARLRAIQAALGSAGRSAAADIDRLAQLVALLRSRQNAVFALPAAVVMWTTQVAHAIEAWRRRVGPHVGEWLDAVADFEALAALSTYAAEHPDAAWPSVEASTAARIEAQDVAHPLLSRTAVANDVALGADAPRLLIVSGSNMSGKSTFLRAIGLNVVLAHAGAPVRASRFRSSALAVGASIRVVDSLQEGQSRFFAEITRLKAIVDQARDTGGHTIFLLDEILAGTNSHDRRLGAEALLTALVQLGAIGLATTHDLALGEIASRPEARATNVHFDDRLVDGRLVFDYRLKPGIVRTSNALPLMASIGLITADEQGREVQQ
jgi:hypothetical protein